MGENARAVRLRVGKNVKRLREDYGWSQEQLAEAVGNTAKHIGQVERGEVNVGLDILTGIAGSFSVKVADLLDAAMSDRIMTLTEREVELFEKILPTVQRLASSDRRRGRARQKNRAR